MLLEEPVECGDGLLQNGRCDRAVGDGQVAMCCGFAITERGIRGAADVQTDAIAVVPGMARKNANVRRDGHMRSLQCFDEDRLLHCELRGVVCMLVVAAAATPVVFAARSSATGRRLEHGIEFGGDIAAAVVRDGRFHQLTGQGERDEDRLAGEIGWGLRRGVCWNAGQRGAAIDHLLHTQLHVTHPVAYRRD